MSVVDAGLCRLRPCPDAQLCEIKLLRRALDRLPKFQGTVYRCMSLDSEDKKNQFIERWTDTQDAMTGFMSTTYRRKNARLYMKKGKPTIIFVVKNSTCGAYIGHLSGTPRDEEILFDCNQRFRLLKEGEPGYEPRREVGNVTYITVTEVNWHGTGSNGLLSASLSARQGRQASGRENA